MVVRAGTQLTTYSEIYLCFDSEIKKCGTLCKEVPMKYILILLVGLTLVGCAAGGGSSATGGTADAPAIVPATPGCKAVASVWNSTTDLEQFDLRPVISGVAVLEYEYRGADGLACTHAANPNHSIGALLRTQSDIGLSGLEWDYWLRISYSLPIGGSCGAYGTNQNSPTQDAWIIVGCNSIEVCKDTAPGNALHSCKLFN